MDLSSILESSPSIPLRERRKADLLVTTIQFHDWVVAPRSRELLIHGDFRSSRAPRYISALSHFCATLTRALQAKKQYVVLAFFCGSHVEHDDRHRGARAMARSLVAQLLQQWSFDSTALEGLGLDLERVRKGNLGRICALLGSLVCRLPEHLTLVCVIDGISHYETDDFEEGMMKVLLCLLGLARDSRVASPVKVLATSPTTTDLVQSVFRDDDSCFVSLSQVRDAGQVFGSGVLEDDPEDDDISCSSKGSQDSEDEDKDDGYYT